MAELATKEIHEIVGMTLERLKQARKELACVNVKAKQMAKDVDTVAEVLRGGIAGSCASGLFLIDIPGGKKEIIWPTVQDMHDILLKRERLLAEIEELKKDAKQMGHDA